MKKCSVSGITCLKVKVMGKLPEGGFSKARRLAKANFTKRHAKQKHLGGKIMSIEKLGLFAGGILFGTAGVKILSGKDAKKVYTHTTAAALRAKESVMTTATLIRENAEDILADAKAINEERAAEEDEMIEDCCECCDKDADDCCEDECAAKVSDKDAVTAL